MSAYRGTWWAIAAAALVVSACKDGTAPQLSNPQQLGSDVQTVASVFDSPAFQSFGALDSAPGSPVAASAPAGALLGATRVAPPQTARLAYADAPARLQAFRTAASALSSPLSAQVIPSTVWGKVYVWDVATHHYAEDEEIRCHQQDWVEHCPEYVGKGAAVAGQNIAARHGANQPMIFSNGL